MLDLTECKDIKPQNILLESTKLNDMFEHAPSKVFRHASPVLEPDDYYTESEEVVLAKEDFGGTPPPRRFSMRLTDFGTGKLLSSTMTMQDLEADTGYLNRELVRRDSTSAFRNGFNLNHSEPRWSSYAP
jgi:serine/threonine protein kinase